MAVSLDQQVAKEIFFNGAESPSILRRSDVVGKKKLAPLQKCNSPRLPQAVKALGLGFPSPSLRAIICHR